MKIAQLKVLIKSQESRKFNTTKHSDKLHTLEQEMQAIKERAQRLSIALPKNKDEQLNANIQSLYASVKTTLPPIAPAKRKGPPPPVGPRTWKKQPQPSNSNV